MRQSGAALGRVPLRRIHPRAPTLKFSELLDPLLIGLAIMLAGLILWQRSTPKGAFKRARILAWAGFAWLVLASCPLIANALVRAWQPLPTDLGPSLAGTTADQRALVVLSAGKRTEEDFVPAIEQLDGETQGRVIGAARVYRTYGFGEVVVTGTGQQFVAAMADFLVELGVPRDRILQEPRATNTRENATFTAPILAPRNPARIVLVTSALHMRRAIMHFHRAGMQVIPAPVDYVGGETWRIRPSTSALARTKAVLHEVLGMLGP